MWLMVITVRCWWCMWWLIGGTGSLVTEVQEAAAEMHPEHMNSCWKPAGRRGKN